MVKKPKKEIHVLPLSKNGRKKYFYVHNLVANAFLGVKPKRHDVDHIDKNRTNNNISNLRHQTYKQNRGLMGNNHASPNYIKE